MQNGLRIGGEIEMTQPNPPKRRRAKQVTAPVEPVATPAETPVALDGAESVVAAGETPQVCNSCRKRLDWRDEVYGATVRGLCRTCLGYLRRYALKGNYQKIDDGQGGQRLNIAGGQNRAQRRESAYNATHQPRTPPQTRLPGRRGGR